jgi:hypothetical protein
MFTEKQLGRYADTYNGNSQKLTKEKKKAIGFNDILISSGIPQRSCLL